MIYFLIFDPIDGYFVVDDTKNIGADDIIIAKADKEIDLNYRLCTYQDDFRAHEPEKYGKYIAVEDN